MSISPDWISAGADFFAAAGTIGAFTLGLHLYNLDRIRSRGDDVRGVRAEMRPTDRYLTTDEVIDNAQVIYSSQISDIPAKALKPSRLVDEKSGWQVYELWIHNTSAAEVIDLRAWIPARGLSRPEGVTCWQWRFDRGANMYPVRVMATSLQRVMTRRKLLGLRRKFFGVQMSRSICAGELVHAADIAALEGPFGPLTPRRLEPAALLFSDQRGQIWSRDARGRLKAGVSAERPFLCTTTSVTYGGKQASERLLRGRRDRP